MTSRLVTTMLAASLIFAAAPAAQQPAREIDAEHIKVPDGYRIEAIVANLSVPTTAIFDGDDLLIAESGFKNTATPRVLRVKPNGKVEIVASEGLKGPVTGLAMVRGNLYVSHMTKVSVVENGRLRDIVTDLPSLGDHHNNNIVAGPDGKIYMSQGTVTNGGVVGVAGTLIMTLSRAISNHSRRASAMVASVSPEHAGETSRLTKPSAPCVRSNTGRSSSAAI